MGETTKISWAESTWNPVTGCHKVSSGCVNCYAEALSLRMGWSSKPWTAPNVGDNVILHPGRLEEPVRWRKPRHIFTCSMGDLFHDLVPDSFLDQVFGVMARSQHHTYMILTKRPERAAEYLSFANRHLLVYLQAYEPAASQGHVPGIARSLLADQPAWPLPNVWLGTSCEDQRAVDERVPMLLSAPAALHFVSAEPLLGAMSLTPYLIKVPGVPRIEWVIAGGESGINHRPMDVDWARSLHNQCEWQKVPFFFKQDSDRYPGQRALLDGVEHKAVPER